MKNIQKTSGTRKKYKPGQLITICKDVFRITENRSGLPSCYVCNLDLDQVRRCYEYCILCNNNLQDCYLKLVKKHKGWVASTLSV